MYHLPFKTEETKLAQAIIFPRMGSAFYTIYTRLGCVYMSQTHLHPFWRLILWLLSVGGFFFSLRLSAYLQEVSWKLHYSFKNFRSQNTSKCLTNTIECILEGTKLCCDYLQSLNKDIARIVKTCTQVAVSLAYKVTDRFRSEWNQSNKNNTCRKKWVLAEVRLKSKLMQQC